MPSNRRDLAARVAFVLIVILGGGPAVSAADSIDELLASRRYAEAETAARAALAELEGRGETESLETARLLDLLAAALLQGDKATAAETKAVAERSLALRERLLSPPHADIADSLHQLGVILTLRGEKESARALLERALVMAEATLGPDHGTVARDLHSLGNLLMDMGDYAGARDRLERALAIGEKAAGSDTGRVADIATSLAIARQALGDYAGSRRLFEKAVAVHEKNLGPEHVDVAKALENLATLLDMMADYAASRPLHERSLALLEKALGPDHPSVGVPTTNLGMLLQETGDYAGARRMLERSVAINEKAFGRTRVNTANALTDLGVLLATIGDLSAARPVLERAVAISEEVLGSDHPDLAEDLNHLALVLVRQGDVDKGRSLIERALTLRQKALGADDAEVAALLTSLATIPGTSVSSAEELHRQALSIREKALGTSHPQVAESLMDLANDYEDEGRVADARREVERALAVRERTLGSGHPSTAESRATLARLMAAEGDTAGALSAALDAERTARQHYRLTIRALGERQALLYGKLRNASRDLALTLLTEHPDAAAPREREVLDAVVRSRSLVLDEMAARHRTGVDDDPEVVRLREVLAEERGRLAGIAVRGPRDVPVESYRKLLGDAREAKEKAEVALAARSSAFREELSRAAVGADEVEQALPEGGAIVSFVRYERHRPEKGAPAAPGESADSYGAFVWRRGREVKWVPLGHAEELDGAVAAWRAALAWEVRAPGLATRRSLRRYQAAAVALRRRVWDPVESELAEAQSVFVIPDGALHHVNFIALPRDDGRYLVEAGPLFHYLAAERDLALDAAGPRGRGVLALADPDFSVDGVHGAAHAFRGSTPSCDGFRSLRFSRVPAARQELRSVGALWRRSAASEEGRSFIGLEGREAGEAAFKENAAGRRILHLATHGFVLAEQCAETADNPLLRSGLALAGANHREAAPPQAEDGILTAEEVAALDLSGVEWAVLSACETGMGDVKTGEGVYGLPRAFQVAGVRTVIMSLWPVTDDSSRRWMERLYRGRLLDHLSTAEAVRRASRDSLRERRRTGASTHPLYWAGFVAVGDWR